MPNIALYCDCYNNNRINRENKVYILLNQEINNNYKNISNLVSKYFKKIKLESKDKMVDDFVKQHYFDKMKLIDKFSKYKLIITDNWLGMIISVISESSCIVIDEQNEIFKNEYNNWFNELNYISFINDYSDLEKKIMLLKNKNTNNIYNKKKYNEYFDKIKKFFLYDINITRNNNIYLSNN